MRGWGVWRKKENPYDSWLQNCVQAMVQSHLGLIPSTWGCSLLLVLSDHFGHLPRDV